MNAIVFSAIAGVVMMFSGILLKNAASAKNVSLLLLVLLLFANVADTYSWYSLDIDVKDMLLFNKFGFTFNSIVIVATIIYILLCGKDIERVGNNVFDYHALLFFVLCGISILTSFNNLLMFFLGVEIMSIPLYILTGFDKRNLKSNEASLKYFLMGAFSTGILLMGIAFIYGATGSFGFDKLVGQPNAANPSMPTTSPLVVAGMLFIFVSMAFKVSAAPFHFWTPDVYDGAPSVFTAFMATIVKAAAFIAFIRLFEAKGQSIFGATWQIILSIVIIATLIFGNITAVFQQSVKRMLAYSSIAQAAFMLFSLWATNDLAKEGILLYTVAYSLATIGIFAILMKMKDYTFEGYNGLAKSQPLLAFANTIFILSLAGIPLTAGFFAKYYMLAAVVKSGTGIWLVIVAVLFAAISVYYYFRLIQAMYFKEGEAATTTISTGFKTGVSLVAALIILIGILPSTLLYWLYF